MCGSSPLPALGMYTERGNTAVTAPSERMKNGCVRSPGAENGSVRCTSNTETNPVGRRRSTPSCRVLTDPGPTSPTPCSTFGGGPGARPAPAEASQHTAAAASREITRSLQDDREDDPHRCVGAVGRQLLQDLALRRPAEDGVDER